MKIRPELISQKGELTMISSPFLGTIFYCIAFISYFIAIIAWLLRTKGKRSDTAIVCSGLSIFFFALAGIFKFILNATEGTLVSENFAIEFTFILIGIALSIGVLLAQKKKPKNEPTENIPELVTEEEEEEENSGFSAEEIESWVENKLAEISKTKVEDIATGYPLTDYCADSLDQLGFKTDINEHFGIDFEYDWKKHGEIYSVMDVINDIKELLEIPEELSENQDS